MSSVGPFDANAAFSSFLASLRVCASPAELHAKLSQFLTLVLLNPEGCVDACLLVIAVATAPLRSIITHQFPGHSHFGTLWVVSSEQEATGSCFCLM
jgi:hypothetical protein